MRLIVDTNIILSALIKSGLSRKIISSQNIEFYTLDYIMEEINKYMDYIVEKSDMEKEEVETLLAFFMENIVVVSDEEVKSKIEEAKKIMKEFDINDAPILACALAIKNDGIWSEDKHFHIQKKVKAWHTKDLMEYL